MLNPVVYTGLYLAITDNKGMDHSTAKDKLKRFQVSVGGQIECSYHGYIYNWKDEKKHLGILITPCGLYD